MSRLGLTRRDLPARMLLGNQISLFPSALARIQREKSSDQRVHLLSKLREICKELTERELSGAKSWKNFGIYGLTPPDSALVSEPRQTRDSCKLGVCSTYIWDCKLEAQFCPRLAKATAGKPPAEEENRGREIEFFF
jgi:hypothetical protein